MARPIPPPAPQYGYYPMSMEGMLTNRNVFALNAVALIAIWFGALLHLASSDPNVHGLSRFLVISGAVLGALGSLAGALGSKRTSDSQNLGLLNWSGLLLVVSALMLFWIG